MPPDNFLEYLLETLQTETIAAIRTPLCPKNPYVQLEILNGDIKSYHLIVGPEFPELGRIDESCHYPFKCRNCFHYSTSSTFFRNE